MAQKFANPRVLKRFLVYSDREQLVEAKSGKKSDNFSYRLLVSRYAVYHAQMYADTQTKILFIVFAILGVYKDHLHVYHGTVSMSLVCTAFSLYV